MDRGPYALNQMRGAQFEFKRDLNKIGKPVDRNEWGMTPPTVNAYYNPEMNEIVFPAGILQPPFFDPKADDASNYGAMGAVIGHEMTHGFDDEGRKFDAQGNLRDWWTPEDAKNFDERAACVEKQFDSYVVQDDIHENGKLVLGESIADLGGLNLAYRALQKAEKGKKPASDRRLDGGPALFSCLRANLGVQRPARIRAPDGEHEPASAWRASAPSPRHPTCRNSPARSIARRATRWRGPPPSAARSGKHWAALHGLYLNIEP